MASFGERLTSLRESRGMTQDDLADELGITKQAVSHYERGRRRPDFEILSAICDLFNVSMDFLLGKSDYTTRLLDENELNMVDEFYSNPETARIAQTLYQRPDLALLFEAAEDASPEDVELTYQMLKALKAKEQKS